MERFFDQELEQLHKDILRMGSIAEGAIANSIEALKNRDRRLAEKIISADQEMDEMENIIDEKCIDLIARHQPMAKDLRFLATGLKINADLERIADLAVDICERVLEIVDMPLLKPLVDTPKLSVLAQRMVKDCIGAFIKKDLELARKVIIADQEADTLRDNIQKELINDYMVKDGATVTRAVALLLIARYLERICDHATNIAEDVIYMVQGKMVKHHPEILGTD